MSITTNPNDPCLKEGQKEQGQNDCYLVLSEFERSQGFVRPYRDSYVHKTCGVRTKMGVALSETYARNPKFYGATFCIGCNTHYPVSEFLWDGTNEEVGS